MAKKEIGSRVGAILKATDETVFLFGYGIYEGDFVPESGIHKEVELSSPRIRLDNGGIVYGYQCWWGSEAGIRDTIGNRKVEIVPVPEAE